MKPFTRPAKARALVIGEMGSDRRMRYLADGWRQRGWDVDELDFNRFFSSGITVPDKIATVLFDRHYRANLRRAIEDRVINEPFDVVVFIKAAGANADLISQIKRTGALACAWYPDVSFDHPIVEREALSLFDLFFTTKHFHREYLANTLGGNRVHHIDHGYLPAIHRRYDPPVGDADKSIDCCFIGNHSKHKERVLQAIIRAAPGTGFVICGARWENADLAARENVTLVGQRAGDGFTRLLNHAKVALAFHHGPSGSEGWEDAVSARTFEFPACGAAMVHIDNEEVRRSFVAGEEFEAFSTPEDASEKIQALIADDARRHAMAERGWRRAVPAYALTTRAQKIAEIIEQRLEQSR